MLPNPYKKPPIFKSSPNSKTLFTITKPPSKTLPDLYQIPTKPFPNFYQTFTDPDRAPSNPIPKRDLIIKPLANSYQTLTKLLPNSWLIPTKPQWNIYQTLTDPNHAWMKRIQTLPGNAKIRLKPCTNPYSKTHRIPSKPKPISKRSQSLRKPADDFCKFWLLFASFGKGPVMGLMIVL